MSLEYCSEAVVVARDAIRTVDTAIDRFRQSVDDKPKKTQKVEIIFCTTFRYNNKQIVACYVYNASIVLK